MDYSMTFAMPGAFHFEAPPGSGASRINGVNPGVFRPPTTPSASSSIYNIAKSTDALAAADRSTAAPPSRPPLPHASNSKRKRESREPTPLGAEQWTLPDSESVFDPGSPMEGSRGELRYTLAGHQMDTPAFAAASFGRTSDSLQNSAYSDADYRRGIGFGKSHHVDLDASPPSHGLFGSSHQHQQASQQSSWSADGWSRLALNTIGAVAGKVWEFCKAGAFRGFYAGGGKGYSMNGGTSSNATPSASQATRVEEEMWHVREDIAQESSTQGKEDTFRADGTGASTYTSFFTYGSTYGAANGQVTDDEDVASRPSAKRRQLSSTADAGAADDLRRHWVMVKDPDSRKPKSARAATRSSRQSDVVTPGHGSRLPQLHSTGSSARRISVPVSRLSTTPASLGKRTSAKVASPMQRREPASTASMRVSPSPSRIAVASSPTQQLPTSPALRSAGAFSAAHHVSSRPSSRSGRTAAAIPSRLPMPVNGLANNRSRPGTPTTLRSHATVHRGHTRTASNASQASAAGMRRAPEDVILHDSPRLDAEARQLAQRKIAAERETSARVDVLNDRLLDMIRMGREALGSRVEIEMLDDDVHGADGYVDDGSEGEDGVGGWVSDN